MNESRYSSICLKSKSIFFLIAVGLFLISSPVVAANRILLSEKNPGQENKILNKGDITQGKKIYNKYCHYCHGAAGRGDGAIAIGVTPHPVNFVKETERMKKSDQDLFQSISQGIRRDIGGDEMAMPQWNLILSEEEIWSVLFYVRYLSQKGQEEDAEDN